MEKLFESILKAFNPTYKKQVFYIAISGGKDSMVLTHLLLKLNLKPILLHCNFNLRGQESIEDALFIKKFAEAHQLTYFIKSFDTLQIANAQKKNIQLTARDIRYQWFSEMTEEGILLTAHHLNDKVETFHIHTLRGTGLKGLTSIPAKRDNIFRPLLNISSKQIEKYINDHDIQYRQDSSNAKLKYRRNNIRHAVIPLLESITPDYIEKMKPLMDELSDVDQYITEQVQLFENKHKKQESNYVYYPLTCLSNLADFFLIRLFKDFGVQRAQISSLTKLLNATNGAILETKTHTFLKDRSQIQIQPKTDFLEFTLQITDLSATIKTPFGTLHFETLAPNETMQFEKNAAYLNKDLIVLPLTLTNVYKNTKFHPFGMKGKKRISDYLIDHKKSIFEKNKQLLLKDQSGVLWLVNERIDDKYQIQNNTNKILRVTYSE
ncbi:tRNA lysidine(34) synthetase TilS [Putridiphycobacter roseus]|uniref:tRNA(Ile)-lysidine synthase n=1 Tax=Putridiphycobacter roseus TaxID=2219161 RepID=A0A2W1NC65_9FLAO|nr:tRNA lysidine(34) synthetase TilS [Putridiphycobacter roseus]PZE15706.1 tRNA lysidine(34) synthetase TilS [Putridiphycobacter roseus]